MNLAGRRISQFQKNLAIIEEMVVANCDHSTDDAQRYINAMKAREAEKLRESLFSAFQEKFEVFNG